jgi:TatD DNase family protein
MLIDTHAHLDFPEFQSDLSDVISRAAAAGVTQIVAMATRVETSREAVRIAETFPGVWAAVGIHPLEVGDAPLDAIDRLRELARHPKVVAIGEIGLDYHALDPDPGQDKEVKQTQAELFRKQLDLAAELKLNVVLHTREAFQPTMWADALRILAPYTGRLRAVFHCFKGTPAQAQQVAAMGHFVSFTGMVTYPEMPQLPATASVVDSRLLMLETDAPYMNLPPDRDGRCESAFLREIAEHVAALRGVSLEQLAAETSAVARDFFRLPAS